MIIGDQVIDMLIRLRQNGEQGQDRSVLMKNFQIWSIPWYRSITWLSRRVKKLIIINYWPTWKLINRLIY